MERPSRKQNRLSAYRYGQVGNYFVTICTQNRTCLFARELTDVDEAGSFSALPLQNQILHRWVRKAQKKYPNMRIENHVIMPDHLHMIVTIDEERGGCTLPDLIRFFKQCRQTNISMQQKTDFFCVFKGKYGKNRITTM